MLLKKKCFRTAILKWINEIFADFSCRCDSMFKGSNKRKIHCLWLYCKYFTQKFKLNPFYNFFFHIGIFNFPFTNCPSKISVPFFIDNLNYGFRKYLTCSLQCIWLNHKPCFVGSAIKKRKKFFCFLWLWFRTNDS